MMAFPRGVWAYALVIAALTSLPYAIGVLNTPAGWGYSGAAAVPAGTQVDFNSHLAKMWQGARGQWDYHLLFTHEDHPGLPLVQGFYVALGAVARLTPFDLVFVYHLARFALTVGMVLALWAFASHFFERDSERWLALLFGTVVSGWSWLLLFIDPAMTAAVSPIEFWLLDAFNLLGALYMPHFAAAVILQIVTVLAFERWVRGAGQRTLILLTLALAGLSLIQPYVILLIVPLLVVLTSYHLFSARRLDWRRALWLVIPMGIHAGLVVYQYVVLSSDPIWAGFTAQNQTLSPLVSYYVLGYLPFIIPLTLGVKWFMVDKADDRWWLPIIWVALVAVLLYAPFPTQRRYLLGVQTPLAVLAAYGWSRGVLVQFRDSRRRLVTIVYVTVAGVALLGIIFSNAAALTTATADKPAFYQPDEMTGYAWIREHTDSENLVLTTTDLSGRGSGGRLVAATGRRVFLGHWIESANLEVKIGQIERFYEADTADSWREDFLKGVGADYIWYDGYARSLGTWNPAGADYLEAVFSTDSVMIYWVLTEQLQP